MDPPETALDAFGSEEAKNEVKILVCFIQLVDYDISELWQLLKPSAEVLFFNVVNAKLPNSLHRVDPAIQSICDGAVFWV